MGTFLTKQIAVLLLWVVAGTELVPRPCGKKCGDSLGLRNLSCSNWANVTLSSLDCI